MLSLFALPKAFKGESELLQRNALASWRALGSEVEVLLAGDDEGVAEAARDHGARTLGPVRRNASGTPLISDLFSLARREARFDTLCYTNADIVFQPDLVEAVGRVRSARSAFLMTGRRWNLDVPDALDFTAAGAGAVLARRAREEGLLQNEWWLDYFVFTRSSFGTIPDFAIGRAGWDNWLVYDAVRRGLPVIDATACVLAIHQNHGYGHLKSARQGPEGWRGEESEHNIQLAGGRANLYSLADATHQLVAGGLRRRLPVQALRRRLGIATGLGIKSRLASWLRGSRPAARG